MHCVQHVEETVVERDFATCMKLLQNFPDVDVAYLAAKAQEFKDQVCHSRPAASTYKTRTPSPLHPFTPSPLHPFTPSLLHSQDDHLKKHHQYLQTGKVG